VASPCIAHKERGALIAMKKPKVKQFKKGDRRRTKCQGCMDGMRVMCTLGPAVDRDDGKPIGLMWFCDRSYHD
jgi:hypothetical protein